MDLMDMSATVIMRGLLEKLESVAPKQWSLCREIWTKTHRCSNFYSIFRLSSVSFYREHIGTLGLNSTQASAGDLDGKRFHSAVMQSPKTKAFFRTASSLGKSSLSLVLGVIPESRNGECYISGTSTCNLTVFSSNIQIILPSTTWKRRIMAGGRNPEVSVSHLKFLSTKKSSCFPKREE